MIKKEITKNVLHDLIQIIGFCGIDFESFPNFHVVLKVLEVKAKSRDVKVSIRMQIRHETCIQK